MTLSPHGERLYWTYLSKSSRYFNPRSPNGERPCPVAALYSVNRYFNPRSPHGERLRADAKAATMPTFQSTLPARGATRWTRWTRRFLSISIHAPRTGSDADGCAQGDSARSISIHAPRTGSDGVIGHKRFSQIDFNPRSPHGERL